MTDLEKFEKIKKLLEEYGLEDYLIEEEGRYPSFDHFYELLRYPKERLTTEEKKSLEKIRKTKTTKQHYILLINKYTRELIVICDTNKTNLDRIARYTFDTETGNFILFEASNYDYETRSRVISELINSGNYEVMRR